MDSTATVPAPTVTRYPAGSARGSVTFPDGATSGACRTTDGHVYSRDTRDPRAYLLPLALQPAPIAATFEQDLDQIAVPPLTAAGLVAEDTGLGSCVQIDTADPQRVVLITDTAAWSLDEIGLIETPPHRYQIALTGFSDDGALFELPDYPASAAYFPTVDTAVLAAVATVRAIPGHDYDAFPDSTAGELRALIAAGDACAPSMRAEVARREGGWSDTPWSLPND